MRSFDFASNTPLKNIHNCQSSEKEVYWVLTVINLQNLFDLFHWNHFSTSAALSSILWWQSLSSLEWARAWYLGKQGNTRNGEELRRGHKSLRYKHHFRRCLIEWVRIIFSYMDKPCRYHAHITRDDIAVQDASSVYVSHTLLRYTY